MKTNVKRMKADLTIDIIIYLCLFLILLIVAYPLYFIIIASFSDPYQTNLGEVWLYPKGFTLQGYEKVYNETRIWTGFKNSALYTVVGVCISLFLTLPAAYTLSRRELPGKRFLNFFCVFTMLFNGGLVSTYLIVSQTLHLENTFAAMVLPSAVSVYHLMVAKSFMQTNIPEELREAAAIDGCGEFRFFIQIAMPLCVSLISTLVLMFAIMRWNSYVDALLYLSDASRFPLQTVVKDFLMTMEGAQGFTSGQGSNIISETQMANLTKYVIIIICNLPLIIIYPLIQKFLVKGMLGGAIKG